MINKFKLIAVCFFLNGCSVVNFSANYYRPPANYKDEIVSIWRNITMQIHLKRRYQISIINGKNSNKLNGIPAISNNTVFLPEDFIKYIYQNYYDDRAKIFTVIIVHELCHTEFNLPSKPIYDHFKVDLKAIEVLGRDNNTPEYFYKTLAVIKSYWFARKGVAGHALNVGWNAANLTSVAFGGPGFFGDLYATDLNKRMKLIYKNFHLKSKASFKRSAEKS